MKKVVIVEDEKLSAQYIKSLLSKYNDLQLVAILESVEQSVEFFEKNNDIDLILMDIHLKDGNCFDIFEKVKIEILIIFITAYDQYILEALDKDCIHYILKPIDINKFDFAINKFLAIKQHEKDLLISKQNNVVNNITPKENFFRIKINNRIMFIKKSEIIYFVSENRTIYLGTLDGKEIGFVHSLNKLMEELDDNFERIARDLVINMQYINIFDIRSISKARWQFKIKDRFININSENIKKLENYMTLI